MAAAKPYELQLPGQPMDVCVSARAPLLASGLVDGSILLHRFGTAGQEEEGAADAAAAGAAAPLEATRTQQASGSDREAPGSEEPPHGSSSSSRFTAREVFHRPSRKGASCRALCFLDAAATEQQQQLVAGFATGTLLQLDARAGKVVARLTKAHGGTGINRLLALQDQPALVAAGDDDGGLVVWDLRSRRRVYEYSEHTDFISGLTQAGRPQQHALLAVSGDGALSVHDLRAGKALGHSETDADDELLSVAVVKGGKKVVVGSQSGVLALWSWGYWADCSDRFPGHPESVDALVRWDDDTLITGSSDGGLRVVGILPNKLLAVLGQHAPDMPVERLALAREAQLLASASHDSVIKLWDLSVLAEDASEGGGGDDGDDEEEESEWEEAGSGDEAAAAATAAGGATEQQPQPQGLTQADDADGQGKATVAVNGHGGNAGDDSDDDDDASDDEAGGGGRKRRKKRPEKTAMRRGGGGSKSKAGNFFADLL